MATRQPDAPDVPIASVVEGSTTATPARKPYRAPAVRVLGAVHLMTRGNGVTANGDGGQMMMMMMTSDPALKHDIVRVGDHPLGVGLYLFSYRPEAGLGCSSRRHFGVMADEVEAVLPAAVSRGANGYRAVDYAMIGVVPAGC